MKSLFFRLAVIGLLLLCLVSQAFAAAKGKGKTAKKALVSNEIPFDDSVDGLPPKFRGNSTVVLFYALAKNYSKYQKSEFETNDAFQERLRKLDESPLTGKLKYDSKIAIPLGTSFQESYDADNQTMTISIPMSSIYDSDLSEAISGNAVEVFTSLEKTKKYTASNAFGVKAKITGNLYLTFAVALRNDNNLMKNGDCITLKIPMSPSNAREAKTNARILLVGNLLHPYVGKGSSHTTATIDSPTETLDVVQYVAMELTGIWYYNVKSGNVHHKEKINQIVATESEE